MFQPVPIFGQSSVDLVNVEKIAGGRVPRPRLERLEELIAQAPALIEPTQDPGRIARDLERLGPLRDPVDLLYRQQLLCSTASNAELPVRVDEAYKQLRTVQGEDGNPAFPDAAVHVVIPSASLRTRAKLTSFLVRADYDQQMRDGKIDDLMVAHVAGASVFASSEGLWEGLYTFDAYIGPLLGAISPAVWGFAIARGFGIVVMSLGSALNGRRPGGPAEPLQMLSIRDRAGETVFPVLATRAVSDSLSWWCYHLQRFLEVISDPRVFAGPDGRYRPARHLQCLASVEQVFRLTHSIQTSHRDSTARRALFHTVMDTLEGLLGYSTERMCTASFAIKKLAELAASMTDRQAALLLHGAERGVEALSALQHGFFLPRQLNVEVVNVPGRADLSLEGAAAHYVKLLRNATHGYGGKPGANDSARTEALLANHDGEVPHDLPALAYLYLLYLISHPGIVGRNSAGRARK
ncbi:hypothetical protein [Actinomycetospora atypica]|uniref:Uncharacterized protein n=1 Tax=Actinomycetospora atypica TaxID=1290095 RepID=A0ABV9YLD0_9PSEU